MSSARLPAHVEVAGMVRAVEVAGGFAAIVQRGERDAGVILVVTLERGGGAVLWERMPTLDGDRKFIATREQVAGKEKDFSDYLARRGRSDPDCWIVELDIAGAERFIDSASQ